MNKDLTWTEPELCTYEGDTSKPWFVYFDITDQVTGETLRKQFRGGINYWPGKEDRLREGNALLKMWRKKLESGQYNPFAKKGIPVVQAPDNISDAIKKIVDIKLKAVKKSSRKSYTTISNMFIEWLEENKLNKLRLYQFSNQHAQAYLDYLLTDKGYNGTTHNNQRSTLHAIFNEIKKRWKALMPENPFSGIPELKTDVGKNLAYTEDEKNKLIDYFKLNDSRMYYAVNFIYHAYIRKTELCELQVGQIDWENMTIRLNSGEVKNRIQDSVTITEGLHKVLLEMGLDMAPKNFYIFGKNMLTCAEKCTRPDDISERHRALKKAAGMPVDDGKAFYSWKHTGVVAYWKVVKDIYYMMRQLRHHDMKVTMVYLKSLGLMPNEAFRSAKISL
jgi:integrase